MEMNFDFDEQIEQLAKIPKPIRLASVTAILLAVAAGYWFLSYQPKSQQVAQLQGQSLQLQRKLNNVRAVATNLPAFEQEVADLERDLHKALKQLPDSKQFEDLLQDISTAGKQVGVQIKSIQRETEVPHDFYAEVPFRLELEGSYHDLARFFERVGRLARIVNVGALKITVGQEGRGGTSLRVDGRATTFRFLSEDEDRSASLTPSAIAESRERA
jgi:type IV pilus assembly protein PilO